MSTVPRSLNPQAQSFEPNSHLLPIVASPPHPEALSFEPNNSHLLPIVASPPYPLQVLPPYDDTTLFYSYQQHNQWLANSYHFHNYYYGQNGEYGFIVSSENSFVGEPFVLGYPYNTQPTSLTQPTSQLQEMVEVQSPPPENNFDHQPISSSESLPQEKSKYTTFSRVWVRKSKKQEGLTRGGGSGEASRSKRGARRQMQFRLKNDEAELHKHRVIEMKGDQQQITTIMIKNVPYSFSREKLIRCLDEHCRAMNEEAAEDMDRSSVSAYDLVYLPIDFSTKQSRGFAFVNFTNPRGARRFYDTFHNQRVFLGEMVPRGINIACAKLQGKESLKYHFGKSIYETDTVEYLPLCFTPPRDGSRKQVKQRTLGILKFPRR